MQGRRIKRVRCTELPWCWRLYIVQVYVDCLLERKRKSTRTNDVLCWGRPITRAAHGQALSCHSRKCHWRANSWHFELQRKAAWSRGINDVAGASTSKDCLNGSCPSAYPFAWCVSEAVGWEWDLHETLCTWQHSYYYFQSVTWYNWGG